MHNPTYITINGIRGGIESARGWQDNAGNWGFSRGMRFVDHPYAESGSVLRWLTESGRVNDLVERIEDATAFGPVRLIAHSYGCRLSLLAACDQRIAAPEELHLVAGAFAANSDKSGLNEYLRRRSDSKVYIYRGGSDAVLCGPARWSRWLTFGLLGYGDGGYPQAVSNYRIDPRHSDRVIFCDRADFGHSDFLTGTRSDGNLPLTLGRITGMGNRLVCQEFSAREAK